MLIKKSNYDKDDIVSFKLVNGDEIIARIVEDNDTQFIVSKPTTVMPSAQGIGLLQSLFTSDLNNNVVLEKIHVMIHSITAKEIHNHYIKTVTGIETVPAGKIIT